MSFPIRPAPAIVNYVLKKGRVYPAIQFAKQILASNTHLSNTPFITASSQTLCGFAVSA